MRLVFFGTPEFAVPSLHALAADGHEVVAVVTPPDRPRTRSHSTLLPSPIKTAAMGLGLTVLQPARPSDPEFLDAMRSLEPDLGVVVAYGHILRPALLAIPRLGLVNVHASLLPRWRGAAPIHWAVMSGDSETGVSIMRIEAGLDTGGTWLKRAIPIGATDTSGDLFERLAVLGAEALIEALPMIADGAAPVPQNDAAATLAPPVDRTTARIDWQLPAERVSALIRAMDPAPGAWTALDGQPIKLFEPAVAESEQSPSPGAFNRSKDALVIGCGSGSIRVATVQPAARRRMAAGDWLRGRGESQGRAFE